MKHDLREYEDGAVIDADVAIIGAGAAGITMAMDMIGSGRDVLLIESGGMEFEADTQALYEGKVIGVKYDDLEVGRLRFFGGTTNHWHAHCRPLDPIDFERREWVPNSGWPIKWADIEPYFPRAQELCELGPFKYEATQWPAMARRLIPFDKAKIKTRFWQNGPPTLFGPVYHDAIDKAENVRVLLHANLTGIELDDAGNRVVGATLKTLEGKSARLRPRTLVLACGGIENARILLSCNRQQPAGLGNGHDVVGRYFMEHPHSLVAFAVREVDLERFNAYYDDITVDGTVLHCKPGLSEEIQRERGLLNGCLDLGFGYDRNSGFLAARAIGKALARGDLPDEFGDALLSMVADLDGLVEGMYRHLRKDMVLWFATTFEQEPNPDSRVMLGGETDALGMRRVVLDGRITARETKDVATICKVVGEELARLGLARMKIDDWVLEGTPNWPDVADRYHHMGTTRMGDDPRTSVVDHHCRVHGIANLYVAGSSVFTTSGYANSTLTIIALASRLAAHLVNDGIGGRHHVESHDVAAPGGPSGAAKDGRPAPVLR